MQKRSGNLVALPFRLNLIRRFFTVTRLHYSFFYCLHWRRMEEMNAATNNFFFWCKKRMDERRNVLRDVCLLSFEPGLTRNSAMRPLSTPLAWTVSELLWTWWWVFRFVFLRMYKKTRPISPQNGLVDEMRPIVRPVERGKEERNE